MFLNFSLFHAIFWDCRHAVIFFAHSFLLPGAWHGFLLKNLKLPWSRFSCRRGAHDVMPSGTIGLIVWAAGLNEIWNGK